VPRISRFEWFLQLRRRAKSFESGRAGWRLARYEPEWSILSLADSVALTLATGLKTLYSRPILCPSFAQVFPKRGVHLAKSIRGGLSAYLSLCSFPLKNFPAFLLPKFSILGLPEIDTELLGNLFKRQLGIVRSVVAQPNIITPCRAGW